MKIVSFIECRQADVIERIFHHCGLWEGLLVRDGVYCQGCFCCVPWLRTGSNRGDA